jgi:hypothetical protein
MARKRTSTSRSYTIQPFRIGADQTEIGILYLNFRADNLASAQDRALIYLKNQAFAEDIDGAKLLRNNAEVWRWSKETMRDGKCVEETVSRYSISPEPPECSQRGPDGRGRRRGSHGNGSPSQKPGECRSLVAIDQGRRSGKVARSRAD